MRTIEPPLYSHPVKSEYQRQFEWKEGYKFDAPVLSAEQMVFRSDPNVIPRPSVVKTFPKKTEYRSQFVEYPMVDVKSESSEDKENDGKKVDIFETSKVSNGEKEEEKSKLKEPKPRKPKGQRKARKTKFRGKY